MHLKTWRKNWGETVIRMLAYSVLIGACGGWAVQVNEQRLGISVSGGDSPGLQKSNIRDISPGDR
ncbi:hypothetical protein [Halocynthiibacter sp.]|uniref:hypothetical protein n=1 Tax=Halocynthiibacter sp. TaxID=1979210 RepID=UPI003C519317